MRRIYPQTAPGLPDGDRGERLHPFRRGAAADLHRPGTSKAVSYTHLWAFCWLGTGSDEKNIRNFSTYPDEVQKIVKARPELSGNIRQRGPAAIFAGNLLLFTALLFAMGLLTRQEYFAGNFLNTLLLGQALNLFDFLVIDLLWWRHRCV